MTRKEVLQFVSRVGAEDEDGMMRWPCPQLRSLDLEFYDKNGYGRKVGKELLERKWSRPIALADASGSTKVFQLRRGSRAVHEDVTEYTYAISKEV